jgi:hypothetical protein
MFSRGLRFAVGAFPDADATQWHWFVVGIDSLQQQHYCNFSAERYSVIPMNSRHLRLVEPPRFSRGGQLV